MPDINKAMGKNMVGAALAIYGSRTCILLYNTHTKQVEELTLLKVGDGPAKWIVTAPKLIIAPKASNFSPEGVKTCYENETYLKLFQYYAVQGFSIRYTSCVAMDFY